MVRHYVLYFCCVPIWMTRKKLVMSYIFGKIRRTTTLVNAVPLDYVSMKEFHPIVIKKSKERQKKASESSTDQKEIPLIAAKKHPHPESEPGEIQQECQSKQRKVGTSSSVSDDQSTPETSQRDCRSQSDIVFMSAPSKSVLVTGSPSQPVISTGYSYSARSQPSPNKFVDFRKLKKYPYHSVGKIFWLTRNNDLAYFATGFYIGEGRVVTAAHTFDTPQQYDGDTIPVPGNFNDAYFVPAMKDKEDIYGEHYGFYKIIGEPQFHDRYTSSADSFFDICVFIIGNGMKITGGVKEDPIFNYTDSFPDIKPLTIKASKASMPNTPVTVLGYGSVPVGLKENCGNRNGHMMKYKANIAKIETNLLDPTGLKQRLVLNRAMWLGSSGRP